MGVQFYAAFEVEVLALSAMSGSPHRPHVDTLKGSRYANMKELRFEAADGEWRAAFAFNPERRASVLVAGDKSGGSRERFYKELIAKADRRFCEHLEFLKSAKKEK